MKKTILLLMVLMLGVSTLSASSVARDDLGSTFTAEFDYLDRLRGIKASCESPDHYAPLLAGLMTEIVDKVGAVIPETDGRRGMFDVISGYAQAEIDREQLSVNRLNYLTFQLAVAMNPNVESPYEIFEGVDLIIQTGAWQLPYDEALAAIHSYLEAHPSDVPAGSFESVDNLIMTIFRPCDRGQWVFPLVSKNPIYGLKTYVDGFSEGISMTGLPLLAKNCGVHAGLITPGQYVYFLFHDLLHNQTMAPSIDPDVNKAHVEAMAGAVGFVSSHLGEFTVSQQKKGHGTLFLISHELVDYSEDGAVLFDGQQSPIDVLRSMIVHSKGYIKSRMNKAWMTV